MENNRKPGLSAETLEEVARLFDGHSRAVIHAGTHENGKEFINLNGEQVYPPKNIQGGENS